MRPSWGEISEAVDLLPLHNKKPLTQHQALVMAYTLFDPIQNAPFLSWALKFMYRFLIRSQTLDKKEGTPYNFAKALTTQFVKEHLQPAVALAIATKRRLSQRRGWRLDPCPYDSIRYSLECVVDGA